MDILCGTDSIPDIGFLVLAFEYSRLRPFRYQAIDVPVSSALLHQDLPAVL